VLCDVCGRENADSLTFCQDCGRRLKPSPRVVPPTPPAGMPKVELPARVPDAQPAPQPLFVAGAAPAPSPVPTPAPPRPAPAAPRSRPEAPPFYLGPPLADAIAQAPNVAPIPPAPVEAVVPLALAAQPAAETCPSCRSTNPAGSRFCVSCGTPLAKPPVAAAAPFEPAAPAPLRASSAGSAPAPLAPPEGAEHRIVGAPVVEIAASAAGPEKLLECARCHGQCAPGTRFCKYCGAALDRAPAPAATPPSAAPSATPPAAAARPASPTPPTAPRAPADQRREEAPTPSPGPGITLSPAATARPPTTTGRAGRLVVIVEDGSEGRSFALGERQLDIGRTEGDILLQDDLYVSPRHARLIPEGDRLVLRDLDSTNKVYIRIRKPQPLRDGDLLLLGLEVLQFQTVSEAERGLGQATQHGTLLFGSPATPRRARLAQRTVEGVAKDVYHLFRDETILGREVGDIVFTADPFLSRRHAAVRRDPESGEFTLVDLESSNGTFVALREDATLADGDFVRIGQHLFRVDLA
jgi:pSer/pThr/pTyr-binding forkhead associated (FHA) protein/predicted amidophosphoribosyltransferase